MKSAIIADLPLSRAKRQHYETRSTCGFQCVRRQLATMPCEVLLRHHFQ